VRGGGLRGEEVKKVMDGIRSSVICHVQRGRAEHEHPYQSGWEKVVSGIIRGKMEKMRGGETGEREKESKGGEERR
jgi:hypothetical protein